MAFRLKIETENAAFHPDAGGNLRGETARILRVVADQLETETPAERGLYDIAGNKVGSFALTEDAS